MAYLQSTSSEEGSAEAEPPAPEITDPAAEIADLIHAAQQAWIAGRHRAAVDWAQAVLRAGPAPAQAMQAYEIIGVSSCALRDVAAANEAASHLGDARRAAVRAVCENNGLTWE
jgi:hypothetical protein